MIVAIRCDASNRVGSGHVMRCRTLARGLRKNGFSVIFVCKVLEGDLIGLLRQEFQVCGILPSELTESGVVDNAMHQHDYQKRCERLDAQATIKCLRSIGIERVDLMIVDNYALSASWEDHIRQDRGVSTKRLMAIDDLADRRHNVDILLDQNWKGELSTTILYKGLINPECKQLLGTQYALLGEEYAKARNRIKSRGKPCNILVFFGGHDLNMLTIRTVRMLHNIDVNFDRVEVVLQKRDPQWQALKELSLSWDSLQVHDVMPSLCNLIEDADLSIGAGGITTWERACLGLPCLTTIIAENQRHVANEINRLLPIDMLVEDLNELEKKIQVVIQRLDADESLLNKCSSQLTKLCDGRGVPRTVNMIKEIVA